jgi:transmembrane sensor
MPVDSKIDAEAARWTVRLSQSALTDAQQAALEAWLAADERHRGALARARAAWLDLDRLAALAGKAHEGQAQPQTLLTPAAAAGPSRRWFLAAGLGSLALAAGGSAWWLLERRGHVYVSDVGEIRRVTLSDGSSMLLNTATRAVVRFSHDLREVELVHGEGIVEVAKDPARPFVVRTGAVAVRAVGTVFAVRALSEDIDVTVTEGVVEVSDTGAVGRVAPQRVAAEQRAVVTASDGIKVQPVSTVQAERRLAWRDGMLEFDGEPLNQAVQEINRHNVRQIVIDDPALGERPVVGIFEARDEGGFARTVAAALSVESTEDDGAIHLRPRD